jgi:hypothetical protein
MDTQSTRRGFIAAAAALAPAMALAAPAMAIPASDPGTRFVAAEAAFNAGTISEDAYDAALDALIAWVPTTPRDFTRKVICLFGDGGLPNRDTINTLVAQGAQLVGAPA